mgnify:CR=1 FL=1
MVEEREKAEKESIEVLENAIMRNFRIFEFSNFPQNHERSVHRGKKKDRACVEWLKLQDKMCVLILKCTLDAVSITFYRFITMKESLILRDELQAG